MEFNDLWQQLPPKAENVDIIKRDLQNGIAPHLPYFVVGNTIVKNAIAVQLSKLKMEFQYCLLQGQYGNGKTNLLKYLEYYFEIHSDYQVHTEVWRADVDKYDLIRFILYIIQQRYAEELVQFISQSKEDDLRGYCNNYEGSFAPIKNYVSYLYSQKAGEEGLHYGIKLGTGLLNNKRDFQRVGLTQLTDYNRHEVLVFFLNLLAANNFYLLICIDEMEKLPERSKTRFQNFLTSFRELIDLSSFVSGHMLMIAMTDSTGETGVPLEAYNPALARRVAQYIYKLESISKREDVMFLVEGLQKVLTDCNSDTTNLVNKLVKNKFVHTNEYVISAYQLLHNLDAKSWKDYLEEANLLERFEEKCKELLEDEILLNIHTKFFAPMETYCEMTSQSSDEYTIKAQQYQCVRNNNQKRSFIFLFNNEIEASVNRIINVYNMYKEDDLIIFKPESSDLTYDDISVPLVNQKVEIISYNPIQLIAMLEIYQDDYNNALLKEAVENYTKSL